MKSSVAPRSRRNAPLLGPDPVAVVEQAYRLDISDREWLEDLCESLLPLLDRGYGVTGYVYDVTKTVDEWFAGAVTANAGPDAIELGRRLVSAMRTDDATTMHVVPRPLEGAVHAFRQLGTELRVKMDHEAIEARGIQDFIALRTVEPGGRGIVIAGSSPEEVRLDARTQRLWAKVSVHLAAARRLRDAARRHAEAVLTPSGKVEHAEGPATSRLAREALREAALRQERARGRARREDPGRALDLWHALVAGRWSLVDQFERDGRRYIVARKNEHQIPDPRALSPRERAIVHLAALGHANKLIAYELGLAGSTVATHLASALRKLGLRSRTELVHLLAALEPNDAPRRT